MRVRYIRATILFLLAASIAAGKTSPSHAQAQCGANLDAGLVAHYPLDGNGVDAAGDRDGTVMGDTAAAADRHGNPSGSMSFDGNGDYIVADSTGLPTAARTTAFWLDVSDVAHHPAPFGYGGGACGASWFMGINGSGGWSGLIYVSGHCGINTLSYPYPNPSIVGWRHWAVTTDATGTRMFIDGELVTSSGLFVTNTSAEGKHLSMGVIPGPNGLAPYTDVNVNFLQGRMDDVRIYDRALCSAEIEQLASGQAATPSCVDRSIDVTALGVQSLIELDWVNGELWAADAGLNRYVRIDPSIPSALGTVTFPFPINDHGSDFDSGTGRLLHVIDDDEGYGNFDSFAETNLAGSIVAGPVNLAAPSEDPSGLAVDSNSGRVWVTTWDPQSVRQIREIDRTTGSTLDMVGGSNDPIGLAFDAATGQLIYGSSNSRIYSIGIDGNGERELASLPAEVGEITGLAIQDSGDIWIVARGTNRAMRLSRSCLAPPVPGMNGWGYLSVAAGLIVLALLTSPASRRSIGDQAP